MTILPETRCNFAVAVMLEPWRLIVAKTSGGYIYGGFWVDLWPLRLRIISEEADA